MVKELQGLLREAVGKLESWKRFVAECEMLIDEPIDAIAGIVLSRQTYKHITIVLISFDVCRIRSCVKRSLAKLLQSQSEFGMVILSVSQAILARLRQRI